MRTTQVHKTSVCRSALALEMKRAQEEFEAAKDEAVRELDKMMAFDFAGYNADQMSFIDRILAASDKMTIIMHQINDYGRNQEMVPGMV